MGAEKTLSLREELARSLERQGRAIPASDEMYRKEERRVYREWKPRPRKVYEPPENPITPPWWRG